MVSIKILRAGESQTLEIVRSPLQLSSIKGIHRGANDQWSFLLSRTDRIGYLQIAQFAVTTPREVREALESLQRQDMQGLILDLRFCPGGLLDSAVAVARLFLSSGTIVSLHGRTGQPTAIRAEAPAMLSDTPLVVLVNGQTASAAEVLAGALSENGRAIVLGTRTFGKGSVQTLIKLDDGSGAIRLTTSQYRLPSGRSIERRAGETSWGIDPHEGYFVPLDRAQVKRLLERRQVRALVGLNEAVVENDPKITPAGIETQYADPQLAVALKTLANRIHKGEFTPVSNIRPNQIDAILKRDELEARRESLLESLQQLDRELADTVAPRPAPAK
jgi:carboxyl-terminal processing protease